MRAEFAPTISKNGNKRIHSFKKKAGQNRGSLRSRIFFLRVRILTLGKIKYVGRIHFPLCSDVAGGLFLPDACRIDGGGVLSIHYCGKYRSTEGGARWRRSERDRMIIDSESFGEIENAVTQATEGIGSATQLVKGLGPQTEEARAYIGRLLNQILEVQIYVQQANAVLDAVKEANQEETSRQ